MRIATMDICVLIAAMAVTGCSKKSSTRKSPPPALQSGDGAPIDPRQPILEQALSGETRIGQTVATLGDPTVPGFWLRTPLVGEEGKGRVVNDKTGASVQVDLVPMGGERGAGSQLSLASMRLLGGSLTDLPEVTVFQNN